MASLEKFNTTDYCLKPHFLTKPDKIAFRVVDGIDQHQSFTYGELYRIVCNLTAGLKSLQLPKSSVVAIRTDHPLDLLLLFLSGMAADLVVIPTLFSLTKAEFEWILNDSNSSLVFQIGKNKFPSLKLPKSCQMIEDDQYRSLKEFPSRDLSPSTTLNDPAFIFYTSGSSGKPKGVLHAHHAILGRKPSLKYWLPLNEDDKVLHTDNICWTYSMYTGFLDPLTVGAEAIIYTPSNRTAISEDQIPSTIWVELIKHYHITVLVSSPDFYSSLVQISNFGNASLPSLRMAGSAGAPLSDSIKQKWFDAMKWPIYSAFGMSELTIFICEGPDIPWKKNRIGKIQPGRKVAILPMEEGEDPVSSNTMGMLAIHKTELGFMVGYIGHATNGDAHYRGDWFLTQDLISMDEEGYLTYYGRLDSVLKVGGGFRVSPIEIENILKQCPSIIDAACDVLFDPDTQTDQLVAYLVSPAPSKETAKKAFQLLSQQVSDYKIPHFYYFVEQLPRNNRGKLMRSALKKLTSQKT